MGLNDMDIVEFVEKSLRVFFNGLSKRIRS